MGLSELTQTSGALGWSVFGGLVSSGQAVAAHPQAQSHCLWYQPLLKLTGNYVSSATSGQLQIHDSTHHDSQWFSSSEEAGPEGETSCVDYGLQVVVGGDQLCRRALTILRLHRKGLSENHCQRLWEHGEVQ